MIKQFDIFNLKVSEGLEYEDEDDNEYEYKVGDFITVIRVPEHRHWLYQTNKRTFKLTAEPTRFYDDIMMWSTDGGVGNEGPGSGIPEDHFRPATTKEIEEWYNNQNQLDKIRKFDLDDFDDDFNE